MERAAPASLGEQALAAQLVEDLARLGCRCTEAASALANLAEPEERKSGIHVIKAKARSAPTQLRTSA